MNITVTSFYMPPIDRIGAGMQMHMLANAYVRLGHKVSVIAPNAQCFAEAQYALNSIDIRASNRVIRWAHCLSRNKFESGLVHFGGDNHFVSRVPNVVRLRTFHGSCFAEYNVARTSRDRIRMAYLGVTELLGQLNCDVSTVVSADTNRYFPKPNVVIPNGIDLSSFVPGIEKSKNPSILFVGMLDSRKRGRELLTTFVEQIRKAIPNAELWIVRDNAPLDIPGVKVFGSVSQTQLVSLYQQAWCFCLPSEYEGFGIPYIEALACSTTVVSTPNPGANEVLENGKYGVITPLSSLGDTLVRLLGDYDLRACYEEQGLEYVQRFDIISVARQYLKLASIMKDQ
jgi:phosphatidylinositol alpha-mannosyltransferase